MVFGVTLNCSLSWVASTLPFSANRREIASNRFIASKGCIPPYSIIHYTTQCEPFQTFLEIFEINSSCFF